MQTPTHLHANSIYDILYFIAEVQMQTDNSILNFHEVDTSSLLM